MFAPEDRPKFGAFALLAFFLLAWILLPVTWKSFTRSGFDEFHAPLWELSSRIHDLSNYWGHQSDSKKTLITKNRDLARIRGDLQLHEGLREVWQNEIAKTSVLRTHLRGLQRQLGLDPEQSFEPTLARVTQRQLASWWQELSIRKGSIHGLTIGDGAIFSGGIVGRLNSSSSRSSSIELVCNHNFRIVAHVRGDDRPVTFQGAGILPGGRPIGMALDVPHDLVASAAKPLHLETSALGGTFPRGIPIGEVIDLEESGDGLFKNGKVYLNPKIGSVSEVTVISKIID